MWIRLKLYAVTCVLFVLYYNWIKPVVTILHVIFKPCYHLAIIYHLYFRERNYSESFSSFVILKGVLHLWALFLKTLCIFSKNKATSDKVFYGSGQKCSKELKNYSFTSVETIVVKLQWKMCENQYFPCFEP